MANVRQIKWQCKQGHDFFFMWKIKVLACLSPIVQLKSARFRWFMTSSSTVKNYIFPILLSCVQNRVSSITRYFPWEFCWELWNYTAMRRENGTLACFHYKMPIFMWVWHKVKVLPRFCISGTRQQSISALKWVITLFYTTMDSVVTGRQT